MLISLDTIVQDFNLNIRGVIHIGAHHGQEYSSYVEHGIKNMIFFEPVKANYEKLLENLLKDENIVTYNIALGNEVGVREMYVDNYQGQSNSLLEPGTHLKLRPDIQFPDKEQVSIIKLDYVDFDRKQYNMINIDVQGFELEVFKGAVETLKSINIIYAEVNFEEVYKGCCQVEELDVFLSEFGFKRVLTKDSRNNRRHNTWGDALYLKK